MQGWMIALIAVACVVVALAVAFLIGSLIAVHIILGRRKELTPRQKAKKCYDADTFGVDVAWFDVVGEFTREISIVSFDNLKLKGMLIKHSEENSERVAVCCHGYGANPRSMQPQAKMFYDRGFDVLLPAMRGHGNSEGKIGMAWLDRFDVLRWIDRIIELYGENVQIAINGTSMGGATVIAVSGMNPPPQVKCVIDDCGFSSQYEEYSACLGKVPLPHSVALLPLTVGVKLVHGYSIKSADIVPLARQMQIPALFIHGEKDTFVPMSLGRKLFDACGSAEKKFFTVPDAAHACAYVRDPQGYSEEFTRFVDAHIEGSELLPQSDIAAAQPTEDAQPTE